MSYAKLPKDFPEPNRLPKRYFEDSRWIREQTNPLSEKYPDQWIAVLQKEVVVAGKDLAAVEKAARQSAAAVGKGPCVYTFVESFQRARRPAGIRY